jgi:D-beta-D-heptose 7-phosphate kinase/D-beta-D-heptose 1-phosphate adenosyltransferase
VDAFCGFNIKNENDLEFAAKKILHDLACGSILITEGKEGMTLFEGNNEMIHIPTVAKEIFDVSGAGDCVVAMISLGIASGMDLEAAVRLANFAAGIVVGKMGTDRRIKRGCKWKYIKKFGARKNILPTLKNIALKYFI